jgi:RNA polymerase sigma-70 factor (ECF subfamily)
MANQGPLQVEQQLIEQIRIRQEAGMKQLYESYGGALYHLILKVVRREEIGSEVLQDVMLKIWHNIESYDANKSRFFTWMARIARNAAIDALRSKGVKRDAKTESLPDYVSNSERHAEYGKTDTIGLRNLLGHLDEDHRKIIDLLYFQEYSQSEAAKELDMPLGTVKTRARRAILQLREYLQGDVRLMGIVALVIYLLSTF